MCSILSIDITEADKGDTATPNEADPLADKGTINRRTVLHGLTWVSLLCTLNFFTSKVFFFSFFFIWTPVTPFKYCYNCIYLHYGLQLHNSWTYWWCLESGYLDQNDVWCLL